MLTIAACGGGGGGSDDSGEIAPPPPPPPPGFVIGETLVSPAPGGDDFYIPPTPMPGAKGDVIWATQLASRPDGRIWKVLYRSESHDGTPIAVSGWIGVPDSTRPANGYPMVAFAHGTTGLADQCAPTIRSSPQETIALLDNFLARGFAVAATDYEGLGTPGLHQYLIGPSQSRSVLDSARAAQRFAGASNKLVMFGHSQGGHAVILANEVAASYAPELDVLGTIGSGSGVFDATGDILGYLKNSTYKGYVVMAALAQKEAYGPVESPLSLWLTEDGIQAAAPLDTVCVDQLTSIYGSLSSSFLFVPNAPLPRITLGYDTDSIPGLKSGVSPLLMIHGRWDDQIPPQVIVPWVESTCDTTNMPIQLEWFDTGHRVPYENPAAAGIVVFDWIEDRFAGRTAPSSCGAVPQP